MANLTGLNTSEKTALCRLFLSHAGGVLVALRGCAFSGMGRKELARGES